MTAAATSMISWCVTADIGCSRPIAAWLVASGHMEIQLLGAIAKSETT